MGVKFTSSVSVAARSSWLPMALALLLAMSTWWLWPEAFTLWRKLIAVALSVSLGFQIATAMRAANHSRVAAYKAWLECGSFLLVIAAFLHLPAMEGWLLLMSGWAWRHLVGNLWR